MKPTFPVDGYGNELLSLEQMAVIVGVSEADIHAEFKRQHEAAGMPLGQFTIRMPGEWMRRGRARMEAAGTTDFAEALVILPALEFLGVLPEIP